jgi:vanillate O-demethylase monooxygenase subunit
MDILKNAWYVAAWAHELRDDQPLARRLLDQPVVLFRDAHGVPHALADHCPHRFAPLHRGDLRDGTLGCPYHGLRFDGSGQCVHNPHGDGHVPAAARVRAYPLCERFGAVWIWMDERPPCTLDLPWFDFIDPQQCEVSYGYLQTQANYQLSADNLLDLSHFQFLHPSTLGSAAMAADSGRFEQNGETVWSRRDARGELLPPFVARGLGLPDGTLADRRIAVRWDPPCLLAIEVCVTPASSSMEYVSRSAHLLTPESATSTHYFYAVGLPKALGELARTMTAYAVTGLTQPFRDEDLPMLAAQQRAFDEAGDASPPAVLLPIDGGIVRARRVMERKLALEAAGQTRPHAP